MHMNCYLLRYISCPWTLILEHGLNRTAIRDASARLACLLAEAQLEVPNYQTAALLSCVCVGVNTNCTKKNKVEGDNDHSMIVFKVFATKKGL